jgi:hypothetical protein
MERVVIVSSSGGVAPPTRWGKRLTRGFGRKNQFEAKFSMGGLAVRHEPGDGV